MSRNYSHAKVKGLLKRESEVWIYSYADLVTNLMAFFVIIIMVKTGDPQTVQRITDSIAKTTGRGGGLAVDDFDRVFAQMTKDLQRQHQVAVSKNKEGVALSFMGGLFFETLSTGISDQGKSILDTLAPVLVKMPKNFRIDIAGHADSRPVSDDSVYPSNWELSAARAAMVVRYLVAQGVPAKKLRAIGYADTVPVSGDIDQNRRVVIRIGKGLSE